MRRRSNSGPALFDAVRAWFADQDIHCLRGPTTVDELRVGVLVEGLKPPTFMMTYNPPYYGQLIKVWFRKVQIYMPTRGMSTCS